MTAGLTTYLMTAGLASDDYRFLGRAPREAFWRKYSEFTSFERPTALLLSKDGAFRAYVSGVRSARRDRTKTPLRYTLVLEGPCSGAEALFALRLLSAFVEDLGDVQATPMTVGGLGRALDTAFPEAYVESALAAMRDGAAPQRGADTSEGPLSEIESRVERAIESLPDDITLERADVRHFWGGRGSPAARAMFLGHAERLLVEAESGAALAVNLASREHLASLVAKERSCAVLFAGEGGEDAFADPLEWPPKKGRPGSPKGLPRAIVLAREAQAEPGFSIRWGQALMEALRAFRDWLLRTPGRS